MPPIPGKTAPDPLLPHKLALYQHNQRYRDGFFAPKDDDHFTAAAGAFWEAGEVERAYTLAQLVHTQATASLTTNLLLAQTHELLRRSCARSARSSAGGEQLPPWVSSSSWPRTSPPSSACSPGAPALRWQPFAGRAHRAARLRATTPTTT